MAIQIWDAQAGQYKSADLARFGGSGTLKEALVWDGTQYVKVWPTEPSLPVVQITGTAYGVAQTQFRQACIDYGTTYDTVEVLPFRLDTSQATDVSGMFLGCSSLTQVPVLDTTNVTEMVRTFEGCSSLTQVPDMDTSNVTNMLNMFHSCSSLTQVPDMDTSQVTNMSAMFYNCSSLTQVLGLDTSQVTNMTNMFHSCSSLTHVSDMDTAQVSLMTRMFQGCAALTDGNVRCIGRHPNVSTVNMITGSGLTREPFYDTNGNPI